MFFKGEGTASRHASFRRTISKKDFSILESSDSMSFFAIDMKNKLEEKIFFYLFYQILVIAVLRYSFFPALVILRDAIDHFGNRFRRRLFWTSTWVPRWIFQSVEWNEAPHGISFSFIHDEVAVGISKYCWNLCSFGERFLLKA